MDHDLFLRTKKLLLRIVRLCQLDVGATVLVPVPDSNLVTVALHNGTCFRYYTEFGQQRLDIPDKVAEVFQSGRIVQVPPNGSSQLATVLGPIRDSLGDVIGVVEFTSATDGRRAAWN